MAHTTPETDKDMVRESCKGARLKTFTCMDAKLRRLLLWRERHHSALDSCSLCIPKHYYSSSRLRTMGVDAITKLRYTEKKALIQVLEVQVAFLSKSRARERKRKEDCNASRYKQQFITNYFFAKAKRSTSQLAPEIEK